VQRIEQLLLLNAAEQEGQFPQAQAMHALLPDQLETLAGVAVRTQHWQALQQTIEQLPPDLQGKAKWRYWWARATAQTLGPNPHSSEAFGRLAEIRQYYGFLAALQIGVPGRLNAEPEPSLGAVALLPIQRLPGIQRSIELFAVNDDVNARREWYRALAQLSYAQKILAAELANQLGLTGLAIRTANIADADDHLHLRFPIAYEPEFRKASMKTGVELPLLLAIARQESALDTHARSTSDARGLMQLLPSTARLAARRARHREPQPRQLYEPSINIPLGSYHLAWLLQRFDGQTPLAVAAYNAGEHRVDRWLKAAEGLPMDVWIEQIPYLETRNYVKNVLAFRQVYGHTLGQSTPFLKPIEQQVANHAD